jgi:hypothetical protein
MVLRTTTNHENNLEKEICWDAASWTEGRAILARLEPECEYDLDVDRHNELLPLSQDGEHAKEFRQFADGLRWAEGGSRWKLYMKCVAVWMFTTRA